MWMHLDGFYLPNPFFRSKMKLLGPVKLNIKVAIQYIDWNYVDKLL
jgi:hypothetical protein